MDNMAKELGMHRMVHSSRKCLSWVPLCSLLASAIWKAQVFFSSSPCGGGNAKWEKKSTKIHFQDRDTEVLNDQVTCQRCNNFFYVDMKPIVVVVQSLSRVQLFETPWTAAQQAFLFSTISQSLLKFMSIELVTASPLPWWTSVWICPWSSGKVMEAAVYFPTRTGHMERFPCPGATGSARFQ